MKRKILTGLLSLTLAIQPVSVCMAEDFSAGDTVTENISETESEEVQQENSSDITEETVIGDSAQIDDSEIASEENTDTESGDTVTVTDEENPEAEAEVDISEENTDGEAVEIQEEEDFSDDAGQEGELAGRVFDLGNGITAKLDANTLTVSGSGAMPDFEEASDTPWFRNPTGISRIVIEKGITRIGNNSFVGLLNLMSIDLPEGLTEIGKGAFSDCNDERLEEITFPNSLIKIEDSAFAGCSGLATPVFGENSGLQTIGDHAFKNTGLVKVTIPASVKNLGTDVFGNCGSLEELNVSEGNTVYASDAGVFYSKDMKNLYLCPWNKQGTSYKIPSGVTIIEENAFSNNKNLQEVILPGTLKTIKTSAFESSAIEKLTIPDSVTSVEEYAFRSCTKLKSAVIGKGLTVVTNSVFAYCSSLGSVVLGSSVKTIEGRMSDGELIKDGAFKNCTSLTSVTFPASLEMIRAGAFEGCTALNLKYPSWLVKMEDGSYLKVETLSYTGNYHYKDAYEVLNIVNQERAKRGLSSLAMDRDLMESAMQRAAETCLDFDHMRPSGIDCFTVNTKASGENIAAGSSTASAVMENWMNSSGHRENILRDSFTSVGIGCFEQGGVKYWVQLFGTNAPESFAQPSDRSVIVKVRMKAADYQKHALLEWKEGGSGAIEIGSSGILQFYIQNAGWSRVRSWPDNSTFKWSSSNSKVATVDQNGKVNTVAIGTTTITATGAGLTATMQVTVKAKPEIKATSVRLNQKKLSLLKGKKYTLKATIKPSNVKNRKLKWTSSNKKVATVDKKGKVTAKKKGTATITVKTANGKKYSCKVTVKEVRSKKIKLNVKKLKAYRGYKFTLKGKLTPSNSTDKITWKSSNPKVATVSSKGVITMKKKGKTVITATTESGKKAKVQVTVWKKKKVYRK